MNSDLTKKSEMSKAAFEKASRKRKMILTGDIVTTIFMICLPLALYNFFNSLYGLIDSMMVANINASSVSAVSNLNQLKTLIESIIMGISAGGAIIVSRKYGEGNIKEARKNANVLLTMGIVLSAILILICIPFAKQIMQLANVPDESIKIGLTYFRIQMGMLALIAFNSIYIGLEKAKGNTKIIFLMNIIVMAVKLSFNVLFIFGFKVQDVAWVAFATLIGQSVLSIVAFCIMTHRNNILRISFRQLSLKKKYVLPIIFISLPIFLGKFVFSLGKVVVNGMCKLYGELTVGALSVSNGICGLVTSTVNTFEDGESTMISQNLGNRNIKRAMKIFKKTILITTILGLVGYGLVMFVFRDILIEAYKSGEDLAKAEELVHLIKTIFKYDSLSIPALAVNTAVLGILYGFGQTKLSMIVNISRVFVFRIPILWYFQTYKKDLGAQGVGISMGISNICIMIMSLIVLAIFLRHIKKNGYKGMHFDDEEPVLKDLIME